MNRRKVFLTVNELKPKMIIAEEIKSNGIVLLNERTELTEAMINKLQKIYFYSRVAVYSDQEEVLEFYKNKTVEEIEESFNDLSIDVKAVLSNIEDTIKTNFQEIEEFTRKIKDELRSTRSVIKNIVLVGSGEDAIYRHSVNVTALSAVLGKWLGFSERDINLLSHAAILHDFGKTKISREILDKVTPLTAEDWKKIKSHPGLVYNYLKAVPSLDISILYGVLMHHERLDGSGYPLGIKEDRIHPFAKIIAIADTFDAINSNRVYRESQGPFEALETLQKESLGKLDYVYCKVFIEHVINFLMGESVLLNTNKICTVIGVNVNDISRPLLVDGTDFIDLKQRKDIYIKKLII
ncbi:HD-GYP domain-containing protein [Clostridium aciditolerans]